MGVDGPHKTAGHLQNTPKARLPLVAAGSQSALYVAILRVLPHVLSKPMNTLNVCSGWRVSGYRPYDARQMFSKYPLWNLLSHEQQEVVLEIACNELTDIAMEEPLTRQLIVQKLGHIFAPLEHHLLATSTVAALVPKTGETNAGVEERTERHTTSQQRHTRADGKLCLTTDIHIRLTTAVHPARLRPEATAEFQRMAAEVAAERPAVSATPKEGASESVTGEVTAEAAPADGAAAEEDEAWLAVSRRYWTWLNQQRFRADYLRELERKARQEQEKLERARDKEMKKKEKEKEKEEKERATQEATEKKAGGQARLSCMSISVPLPTIGEVCEKHKWSADIHDKRCGDECVADCSCWYRCTHCKGYYCAKCKALDGMLPLVPGNWAAHHASLCADVKPTPRAAPKRKKAAADAGVASTSAGGGGSTTTSSTTTSGVAAASSSQQKRARGQAPPAVRAVN